MLACFAQRCTSAGARPVGSQLSSDSTTSPWRSNLKGNGISDVGAVDVSAAHGTTRQGCPLSVCFLGPVGPPVVFISSLCLQRFSLGADG